jgi:hypothetical protein
MQLQQVDRRLPDQGQSASVAQFAQRGAGCLVSREQDEHLLGVGSREAQQFAVEQEGADDWVAPRLDAGLPRAIRRGSSRAPSQVS